MSSMLFNAYTQYFKSAARLSSACIAIARLMVYCNYLFFQKSSGMVKSNDDASKRQAYHL
jgi:hypothetical protein